MSSITRLLFALALSLALGASRPSLAMNEQPAAEDQACKGLQNCSLRSEDEADADDAAVRQNFHEEKQVKQPSNDVETLLHASRIYLPKFAKALDEIAAGAGCKVHMGPLKKKERIAEKMKKDGKEPQHIFDYGRAKIVCATFCRAERALELAKKGEPFKIHREKDLFREPLDSGYRAFNLIGKVGNDTGPILEVQIAHEELQKHNKAMHAIYEKQRTHAEGSKEYKELTAEMHKTFGPAWEEIEKKEKLDAKDPAKNCKK